MATQLQKAKSQIEEEIEVEETTLADFKLQAPKKAVGILKGEQLINQTPEEADEHGVIQGLTTIEKEIVDDLNQQVDNIFSGILQAQPNSEKMNDITKALSRMGNAEIDRTTGVSNRMLSRPMRGLRGSEFSGGDTVATGLKNLRSKVMELDPSNRDKLFSKTTFFGFKLPFANKVDSYLQEYKSSESALSDIVTSLMNGKEELMEDNAHIEEEQVQMGELMQTLEQYAYMMKRIDKKLTAILPDIQAKDKLKALNVEKQILFPIRKKHMALLEHLAVCLQSQMSLDLIKDNNICLMEGVDHAKNTTLTALRTAVIISEALGTQKLVLDQVKAVQQVTNSLIEKNSESLRQQGVEIHKNASEATIDPAVLERAFKNIFAAMDEIDNYRQKALPAMERTIQNMEKTVFTAKQHLEERKEASVADVKDAIIREMAQEDADAENPTKKRATAKIR